MTHFFIFLMFSLIWDVLLCSYVDKHKEEYIKTLEEAVAIQSVSACPEKRGETIRMVNWTADRLKKLGASLELCDIGNEVLSKLSSP